MTQSKSFVAQLVPVIVGVLFVVATIAFVTIPYSLARHPWEGAAVAASPQSLHLS